MPRKTMIVDPWELCSFAEEHFGIGNSEASDIVRWVTPECEVATYDYELVEVEAQDPAEYYDARARELLIEYMKSEGIKTFTLTQ